MTLKPLFPVTQQFQNKNGSNLVGGRVYIYFQGRTALATTYHDAEGTVVNANPVLLDNNGRATVFADTIYSYTIVVCDYYGKELFSQDITLHDAISTAEDVIVMGSDGSVKVDNTTLPNGVQYDLSVNTDIIATKKSVDDVKTDLTNLTEVVNGHTTEIGQIQEDIVGIESTIANKKDKQPTKSFDGSATKTIKNISQDVNGELNVEFENIDYPDYKISSSDESINVSTSEGVTDLTLPSDVVRDSNYVHIEGATEVPLMDGITSVGLSTKYAREDHVHPSDTSREAIANKTTVILGTSNDKYPTDEAVAKFVNSSIATNTANYISNNGEPFTSVEQLEAYSGPVTNNDYAFVTGTDSEGNTYYDRYKATVIGETVTWALEYRLNNSSFTAAQWSAINSGITSALVAKIHTHSNKDVLDGITSSDVANWNSKQNSLTAGDNITIDGNTISSDQVFVAKYGVTTYKEVKDAYNAGKICTVFKELYYCYIAEITADRIRFVATVPDPKAFSVAVSLDNHWSTYAPLLQRKLTFDSAPTAGSTNPVTSDGINTAISNSVDQTYSSTSTKAQSGVAVNEAFKTRETSVNDDSYTYLGMEKTYGGTKELYWKLVSFNTVKNYWTLQFEVDVSNGRKGSGSFDLNIYETKRLTISGTKPGFVSKASELRYVFQGLDLTRGYGNNIYYELSSDNLLTVYIKAADIPNKTQICRLKDVINLTGISNVIWHEATDNAGTQPTNPVKFNEFFPAIASTSYNIGSDSVPVYVNKGKPAACNSSNLKAGKDDNGNVIKNTYATKTELDSRIPSPTSTTGTQVLKCINGVIQWVSE